MAILKGLKNIRQHDEEVERKKAARENKVKWFTLKQNEKAEVIFLQELDETSPRYSEKNGLGLLVQEHSNPSKAEFWRRIMCTMDEEHDHQCWGCEKNRHEWSKSTDANKYNGGWGVKTNLYINALVRRTDKKTGEVTEEVELVQRKRSKQSFVDTLLDIAEEDGFISNRTFSISRKGDGTDTTYTAMPKNEDAGVDVESYDLFDLTESMRDVPYEKQAVALGAGTPSVVRDIVDDSGSDPEDDEDWA